jgi:hypothetical protein
MQAGQGTLINGYAHADPMSVESHDIPGPWPDASNLADDTLLDIVQRQTVRYFWEGGHPVSGLAPDRQKTAAMGQTISLRLEAPASVSWRSLLQSSAAGSIAPHCCAD